MYVCIHIIYIYIDRERERPDHTYASKVAKKAAP